MEEKPPPASALKRGSRSIATLLVAIGFVLVSVALVWQWYEDRSDTGALREDVARRMRDSETDSRDARLMARQAQEAQRETQAKLAQLELKLAEFQSQQLALEALLQDLSRGRDEWVLAEIEQILTIASQHLQFGGSSQVALNALQTADARLSRSGRPQLQPLRKVFARDIQRLKAAPNESVAGFAARLDQLIASVDNLALAQDARPQAAAAPSRESPGLWERLGAEVMSEMKQLVRIQKVEGTEAVLLSPSQSFFLRENLKLRLLNARLALLARDETTYRNDLKLAAAWLVRYFDARSKDVASASATLKQLDSGGAGVSPPGIGESLDAVRAYKASRERPGR
jgi:uroporphyrin-3 C-methyltransferase